MTTILSGSQNTFFYNKEGLRKHILQNILANKNRKVGNEWEVFLVDRHGKAITREKGQKALGLLYGQFTAMGYKAKLMTEKDAQGLETLCGIDIYGLGTITPEIGHQIEFSGEVSETAEEAKEKNRTFINALSLIANRIGYTPLLEGFNHTYSQTTNGSYRSRSKCWHKYFRARYRKNAAYFQQSLTGTSSSQVSLDSGSDNFHEFFKILLLIEPLLTLHYANSRRPDISVNCISPTHTQPILKVWNASCAEEAVHEVVERLLQVEVPFLPDPENPSLYRLENLKDNRTPPNVYDLMAMGRLNESALNNAGGFLLSRPALRRFTQGLIELRGIDSLSSPEQIEELTIVVQSLVYNDSIRRQVLSDYSHFTTQHLSTLHEVAATGNKHALICGVPVYQHINNILFHTQPFIQFYTSCCHTSRLAV